jgi:hypothetical protein
MADDSDVPPLPRRVPGASGLPRPPAGVEPFAIPEDLRQRVLSAIAIELERDRAEQRRGPEGQGGPAMPPAATLLDGPGLDTAATLVDGPGLDTAATLVGSPASLDGAPDVAGSALTAGAAQDGTATPAGSAATESEASPAGAAPQAGDAAVAEGPAPQAGPGQPGAAAPVATTTAEGGADQVDGAAPEGGARRAAAAALPDAPAPSSWFTPRGGGNQEAATAPGREPADAAPRPSVFEPRRAARANGAAQPPAQVRREHLPSTPAGGGPDPEAHTEPLPKISGFAVNPAAMARTQPVPPPATPSAASAPPASALSPAGSTPPETVPPEPDPQLAAASAAASPEATGAAPPVPLAPEAASSAEPPASMHTGYSWLADLRGTSSGAGRAADAAAPLPAKRPAATQAPPRPRRQGRSYRIAGLILAIVILVAAGVVALVL